MKKKNHYSGKLKRLSFRFFHKSAVLTQVVSKLNHSKTPNLRLIRNLLNLVLVFYNQSPKYSLPRGEEFPSTVSITDNKFLVLVIWRIDSIIHQINLNPVDSAVHFATMHLLDIDLSIG